MPDTDKAIIKVKDQINDYNESVCAIIGFASLFFFDDKTRTIKDNVKCFQGRRLSVELEKEKQEDITPDLGVVIDNKDGILAEVKKNFPKTWDDNDELSRAVDIFKQVSNYSGDITNWPTPDGKVADHKIVLLVHHTVSAYVKKFFNEECAKRSIIFRRPFHMVEFSQQKMRGEFFDFRCVDDLSFPLDNGRDLLMGIQIPMVIFVREYSKFKLYDAKPPLPYLIEVLWVNILAARASDDPKFQHLRKRSKLEVSMTIDEITETLRKVYSFHDWHLSHTDMQPEFPKREWVLEACEFLVQKQEAEWIQDKKGQEIVFFFRRYNSVSDHFIESFASSEGLFAPKLPGFENSNEISNP